MIQHQLQRYDHYKNSGIELVQEIPENWSVLRVKDVVTKIGNGVTPRGGSEIYQEEGIPFLRSQNVHDEGLELSSVSLIPPAIHAEMKNSQLKAWDILFNITGASIGRTCIVPKELGEANISQHVVFLRIKSIFNKTYISLFLKSDLVKKYVRFEQNGASKEAFTLSQISTIPLVFPESKEQQAIADYLDTKTAQIDRKIELLEDKAEKYADLKKSLINETVTRGLDKSVPMKDSGVEWIGKIPSHWEVRRVQDISRVIDPQPDHRAPALAESNGYPYIGIRDLNRDGSLNFETARSVDLSAVEKQEMAFRVSPGDIVFCKVGTLGEPRIIIPKDRFALSATLVLIKVKKASNIFLRYALDSSCALKQIEHFGSGSTRPALGIKQIRKFFIPLPPLGEQREIANYLEAKIFQIDKIIERVTTQIEKLKELRKTLINDVVTGKIKVYEGDVSAGR